MNIEFTAINDDGEQAELLRPETKSLDDVRQVCRLHAGNQKMHFVIDLFIELYVKGGQWDWYAEHNEWLESRDQLLVDAELLPETRDPDGDYVGQTRQELIDTLKPEPVRPILLTIDEAKALITVDGVSVNEYVFRINRAVQVNAITVDVDGLLFDGDEDSQRRMLAAIHASEDAGIDSAIWRLADNSENIVTVQQIRQAHSLAIIEQGKLWTKGAAGA